MSSPLATVLLVDDDDMLRSALGLALAHAGFEVAGAEKGSSALEHLRAGRRFDAIVTDLFMPDMGGVEFLRDLPRERRTPHPRISPA